MVLHRGRCGRVGHRRTIFVEGHPVWGGLSAFPGGIPPRPPCPASARAGVADSMCWRVRVCWWCGGAPAVVGRGFRMSRGRPRGITTAGARGVFPDRGVAWRGVLAPWTARPTGLSGVRLVLFPVGCDRALPTGWAPIRVAGRPKDRGRARGEKEREAAPGVGASSGPEERSGREGGPQRRPSGAGFARTGPSDRRSDVPTPPTPTPPSRIPTFTDPKLSPRPTTSPPASGAGRPNPTEHPHHERPRPGCGDLPPDRDRAPTATPFTLTPWRHNLRLPLAAGPQHAINTLYDGA